MKNVIVTFLTVFLLVGCNSDSPGDEPPVDGVPPVDRIPPIDGEGTEKPPVDRIPPIDGEGTEKPPVDGDIDIDDGIKPTDPKLVVDKGFYVESLALGLSQDTIDAVCKSVLNAEKTHCINNEGNVSVEYQLPTIKQTAKVGVDDVYDEAVYTLDLSNKVILFLDQRSYVLEKGYEAFYSSHINMANISVYEYGNRWKLPNETQNSTDFLIFDSASYRIDNEDYNKLDAYEILTNLYKIEVWSGTLRTQRVGSSLSQDSTPWYAYADRLPFLNEVKDAWANVALQTWF